jgi:hypothetical protein
VQSTTTTGDAAAVFYHDEYLPIYYEISASITANKPLAGYKADAYVIFDYFSPTDFKYAGVDISTNKFVLGHRTATGWIQDSFSPAQLKPDTAYQLLVQVNGTAVYVSAGSGSAGQGLSSTFSFVFAPRVLEGQNVGLNKGLIGVGSQQAKGTYDNVTIQVAQPQMTLDTLEDYNDGVAQLYTGATTGTWVVSNGQYVATPAVGATSVATKDADLGVTIHTDSYLEVSTAVRTTTTAGIVFDQYAANDLKFVMLDVLTQRVLVGHIDPRRGYIIETSIAKVLLANTDYSLQLTLKGASVAVTLNGTYVTTWGYNAAVVDGRFGLIARGCAGLLRQHAHPHQRPCVRRPRVARSTLRPRASAATLRRLSMRPLSFRSSPMRRAPGSLQVPMRQRSTECASRWRISRTHSWVRPWARPSTSISTLRGYGWGAGGADLFDVIEHELGHILGLRHEDANDHAVMRAILPIAGLSASLPISTLEATLAPARAAADVTLRTQVEATRATQAASLARAETAVTGSASATRAEQARFEPATPPAARATLKLNHLFAPIALTAPRAGASVKSFDSFLSE